MRLHPDFLNTVRSVSDVAVGNVYPAQGGRKTPGTSYWLVVAVSDTGAHLIGFDAEGMPVSTASYGKHALRERPLIGRADLSGLILGEMKCPKSMTSSST